MAVDRTAPAILVGVRSTGKKNAEPIDLAGRVLSFSFDDDEKKPDKGQLVLDNFDLRFYDEKLLVPGTILDFTWGYNGLFSQTVSLVIKSLKGGTTLTVTCESKKQLINREHNNRVFENVRYSDIAETIAKDNGYRTDAIFVDQTDPVFETVTQARMTDAQFLRHLADKLGFEWYVDTDGFHFHERKIGQRPVRKFIYYNDPEQGDVLNFSIEEKTNSRAGKVTAKGRDPSKKKTHSNSNDNSSDKSNKSAVEFVAVVGGAGLKKVKVTKPSTPNDNVSSTNTLPTAAPDAAAGKQVARGLQRRSALNNVKLTLDCIGDPEITAKAMIEVTGIGKSFSGLYYVEKIKHSVSASGYTMQLTCKRKGRNSGIGGAAAGGKVNKQSAPNKKSKEREPSIVFVPNEDGTGLTKKTVYKKQGKQSKE